MIKLELENVRISSIEDLCALLEVETRGDTIEEEEDECMRCEIF